MIYKLFDKKTVLWAGASGSEELTQELHKPVTKKIKRRCILGLKIIFRHQI